MSGRRLVQGSWAFLAACHLLAPALADEKCVDCHPKAVAGYLKTGMGRSISRPVNQPSGGFRHGLSNSNFAVTSAETGMTQRIDRNGLSAEYPVEYVIGSGNAAFGYLIRVGKDVFQSPVTYYTKRRRWDMAPGMESHPSPDFDRPVLPECLWCHADHPRPVPATQNQYAEPILLGGAISCARCHGPSEGHLANLSLETIVNPAKLPAGQRDSVCEQCHLSGEQRVLNPGKTFGDFRPGMELEAVFSVYVGDGGTDSGQDGRFKVVSHFEQLKLSQCYQKTGEEMWCGTCHSPHEKPENTVSYYRARCLGCHDQAVLVETHAEPADDCVSCHMARRQSRDSGHSAFTDHLIARRPGVEREGNDLPPRLRAWREPPDKTLAARNLGLAYLEIGRRKEREDYLDEGASLLARLAQAGQLDSEGLRELGGILMLKQAPPEAGLRQAGVRLMRDALRQEPHDAAYHRSLAAALWQIGEVKEAVELLNQAIVLDPRVRSAYRVLAEIHEEAQRPELALETWERYLELVPQSLSAKTAISVLREQQ